MSEAGPNLTPEKKKKRSAHEWVRQFIAALRQTGNVRESCKAAGISRPVAYDLKEKNGAFRRAWEAAMEDAIDELEDVARKRALASSDTLMIFLLKSHRPKVYREPRAGQAPEAPEREREVEELSDDELNAILGNEAGLDE